MKMNISQTALTQAIEITNEILALLDDQNISQLDELESRRQSLIDTAFAHSVGQVDMIKAAHLQNLNQQVVDKLITFKQSIQQEKQQLNRSNKAAHAYQSNQI